MYFRNDCCNSRFLCCTTNIFCIQDGVRSCPAAAACDNPLGTGAGLLVDCQECQWWCRRVKVRLQVSKPIGLPGQRWQLKQRFCLERRLAGWLSTCVGYHTCTGCRDHPGRCTNFRGGLWANAGHRIDPSGKAGWLVTTVDAFAPALRQVRW